MTVLIEDQASGTQLIHELVADGLYAVTRYQPQSALTSPIDLAIPGLRVRHQASCALSGRLAWVGKDDLGLPSVIADLPAHSHQEREDRAERGSRDNRPCGPGWQTVHGVSAR